MQGLAQTAPWINTLYSAVTLLLGGGLLGVIVKSLFDRKEQRARTEKIRAETAREEAESYKGFSDAMRAMRQDVDDAEGRLRKAKREREKLEEKIADLIHSIESKDSYILKLEEKVRRLEKK